MQISEIVEEISPSTNDKDEIHTDSDCIGVDGVEPNIKPTVGLGFKSIDDAWEFYKTFGKESGFPVMKSTFKKNVAGDIRSYTFTCKAQRQGFRL